jgi:hypothetical protein
MKHLKFAPALFLLAAQTGLALSFTPGHLYSTNENAINEYSSTGVLLDSFSPVTGGELRGLQFGPDGKLYVVRQDTPWLSTGSYVDVYGESGLERSYTFNGSISGNISYGKITFDQSGQQFYVASANGIYSFDVNGSSVGSAFIGGGAGGGAFDVKRLPNGDFLVASDYAITRYDSNGSLIGQIQPTDPNHLTNDNFFFFVNIRGLEYDAASNSIYVTMLGYSDMFFKLLRLDATSGAVTGIQNYWYGDDLLVVGDGRLVVGSRTQAPGIFNTDLQLLNQFTGPEARFVAINDVPLPSAGILLLTSLMALFSFRRKS